MRPDSIGNNSWSELQFSRLQGISIKDNSVTRSVYLHKMGLRSCENSNHALTNLRVDLLSMIGLVQFNWG